MVNRDPMWSIQSAIFQKLSNDPELSADVSGVFDHVPNDTAFPYVTTGEITTTPLGTLNQYGARSTITLHGWSTYHGKKEISDISNHLLRLLDKQPLEVEGFHTVYVHHEQTVTMTERNNDIRHVACRFAIETELAA